MSNLRIFFILFCLAVFSSVQVEAKKTKEPQFVIKDGYKSIKHGGIVYKGLTTISEKSFNRARYVVDAMLEKVPYIRTRLTEVDYKIVIMADGQKLTDIPEYEYYKGKKGYQSQMAKRRSFDYEVPGMSEYELCVVSDSYITRRLGDDIIAHEIAHAILFHMYKEDAEDILKIYKRAFEKRLFPSKAYLMNNYHEYWAVLSAAWLGLGDKKKTDIPDSAEKIKALDPKIAEFLEATYGTRTLEPFISEK